MNMKRLAWIVCLLCSGAAACGGGDETTPGETTPDEKTPEPEPEKVCADWTAASCEVLAGCCTGEETFDATGCQLQLGASCLEALPPELIRAGGLEYDEAAAKKCFAPVEGCVPPSAVDEERAAACQSMLGGHRPLGAACDDDRQCERPEGGGQVTCHSIGAGLGGICAALVVSTDGTCGFSLDGFQERTCPEGAFCHLADATVPPDASPTEAELVFSAPCKAYLTVGESCHDPGGSAGLRCGEGLFCDITGAMSPAEAKCAEKKPLGAPCTSSQQCQEGLTCPFQTDVCEQKDELSVFFCYGPPVCGDSDCAPSEDEVSCPEDCGFCGDGFCDVDGNEDIFCREDCGERGSCGDGFCDLDENQVTCPQDCDDGFCGDGVCDADESQFTCPRDCEPLCATCGEYITSEGLDLCPGVSTDLHEALMDCVCTGACSVACGDNRCAGQEATAECQSCTVDVQAGCGPEYASCANDV